MKKEICMALAAFLSGMVLYGCQQASNPGDLQLRPKEQEKTVLTLFMTIESSQTLGSDVYRDLITEFNAQSESIEVRVEGLPTADGFNEALERRLETGAGADLFIVNADSVKKFNEKGYFYDLSDQQVFQQLNSAASQQAVVDGTAYCLPAKMTAYGLYVNVGLLRRYGLEPPQNADEFLHCCQVLKENGITPLSLNRWYAMTVFAMARGLYPIYQSENTEEIIEGLNDGSIKISEYMLEGFRFFDELVDKGYYGDNLTVEQTDLIKANSKDWEDFTTEKTAFAVFPAGKEEDIEALDPKMDYILQGIPALPDKTVSLPSISTRICVNAKGEHVEEALVVLEYLTTSNSEKLSAGETGFMTVFRGGRTDAAPEIRALYADATSPGQIPIEDMALCFDYWGTVRTLCLDIIGGATPEEAAREYDRIQMEHVESLKP